MVMMLKQLLCPLVFLCPTLSPTVLWTIITNMKILDPVGVDGEAGVRLMEM